MNAVFTVDKKCPEPVTPPAPDLRKVRHEEDYSDENGDDYGDSLFNVISFKPRNPQLQVRGLRGQESETWTHYIAAEEVTWNYTPHLTKTDRYREEFVEGQRRAKRYTRNSLFVFLCFVSELKSRYLPAAPHHHLSYKYKKVVYVEYTDGSFTQRKNPDSTLLGPVLKGKVNDQFHVSEYRGVLLA